MKSTFKKVVIISSFSLLLLCVLLFSFIFYHFKNSLSYLEPSGYIEGNWIELPEKKGDFSSISFGNGIFVALGSEEIASSVDGTTWAYHSSVSNINMDLLKDITYGDGRFVAVGNHEIITSLDGINWSKVESEVSNPLQSVTYGNGVFVAVGSGGHGAVMRSSNGLIWDKYDSYPNWSVCFGDGLFVAVGPYESSFSSDGISWTRITIPEKSGGGYLTTVAYGNGQFIAAGGRDDLGSVLWTSKDGSNWKAILRVKDHITDMKYGNGRFLLSGIDSFIYSSDGHSWNRKLLPPGLSLNGITYGSNKMIGASSHSRILLTE